MLKISSQALGRQKQEDCCEFKASLISKKKKVIMEHVSNPSIGKAEQVDQEFKAFLGYIISFRPA